MFKPLQISFKQKNPAFYAGLLLVWLVTGFSGFSVVESRGQPEMAFIPFRITGSPDASRFPVSNLSEEFRTLAYFLFEQHKNYPIQSSELTDRSLSNVQYNPEFPDRNLTELCRETRASHLLGGTANFFSGRIETEVFVFSCRTGRVSERRSRSGPVKDLQHILRDSIERATPFIRDRARRDSLAGSGNIIFLIDSSGSMAENLELIADAVNNLSHEVPPGSGAGAIIMKADRNDIVSVSSDWNSLVRQLQRTRGHGSVSASRLEQALQSVQTLSNRPENLRVIILSDVTVDHALRNIEVRIRRLKNTGVEVQFMTLPSQSKATRNEWIRISRALNLGDPLVPYARRLAFREGHSRYIVLHGNQFFEARYDISAQVEQASLNVNDLTPVTTTGTDEALLNFNDFPRVYARQHNLNLNAMGRMVSGLEARIRQVALSGTASVSTEYRILVRNQGRSFWIPVNDHALYQQLREKRGSTLFAGLRFASTGNGIQVIPDSVILDSREVPRLLIQQYPDLVGLDPSLVNPEDIWFLSLEILDTRE